jgi:predicted DNA-binding transcriptional regulator AlpA
VLRVHHHSRDEPPPEPINAGHAIEPLLSIDDLARILSCSRRAVERLRSGGKLPPPTMTVGRCPRWTPKLIREWIERGGHT